MKVRPYVVCLSAVLALAMPGFSQGKSRLTETDLFRFNWIADARISPDGSRVAFVKVWVNQKADRYESALWIVPASGHEPARQLTAGPRDTAPRWSPDGRRLAFVRGVEKDGKPVPQLYLLPLDGGEAQPLAESRKVSGGGAEWSPDGKTIAFLSADEPPRKKGDDDPRVSDVRVINKAVYRSNGSGYVDPTSVAHIWTVSPGHSPKQVTKGKYEESALSWSADGARLLFTARRAAEPYYESPHTDLFSVAPDGGDEKKIAGFDGAMSDYACSGDGKRLAFAGVGNHAPVQSYTQPDLFVVDNPGADAVPRNLTAGYDFDIGGGIGGDQHAPRGANPGGVVWSKDGRSIYVNVAEHGRANLQRIEAASGKVEPLTHGDHEVVSYTASADGARMALVISSPTNIGDLYLLDTASGKLSPPLTSVNDALMKKVQLTDPEEFWYPSFDGKRIQAWIQKPPDFDASRKYPLILEIHGGPHSAYGFTFTHEFQWMAAKGYVVLYTNPRGSTSYGQDFGNVIQYEYPGDDYKDLMAGVDALLKRGYIDETRLGVTGGSGGGVLTNWTVGHTQRFKAAVSQRSIADWAGFWYTADFTLFKPTWFRGAPWEDPADFARRSPITYIRNITTPMMFIEGEADLRTPPNEGGEIMFRALKYRRIPTTMVRFPGESHELSRSGAPWHRVERLQHIVNWFDKYLLGQPIKAYDVE